MGGILRDFDPALQFTRRYFGVAIYDEMERAMRKFWRAVKTQNGGGGQRVTNQLCR